LVASDIPTLNYLPLTGGTLAGVLNGTSATFSSSVTTSSYMSAIGMYTNRIAPYSGTSLNLNDTFYLSDGNANCIGALSSLGGNSTQWNAAYSKTVPFTVLSDRVTIDRDLYVTGNITASKEVTAWISGAVTSDVLSGLSGVAPLWKPTASTIGIKIKSTQFQINASNELEIIPGTVQPSGDYATHAEVSVAIANIINSAPSTLDTLNELSIALGNDPNFATTITTLNGTKEPGFSKNTAFNKNFGSTTGTVLEGRTFGTAASNNVGDFVAYRTFGTSANSNTGDFAPSGYGLGGSPIVSTDADLKKLTGDFYFSSAPHTPTAYLQAHVMGSYNGDFAQIGIGSNSEFYFRWGIGTWEKIWNDNNLNVATVPIIASKFTAPLYEIKNASGVLQWTVSVGTGERLEFKNASGIIEMTLSQSGAIDAKTEITAYSTSL